MIEQIVELVVMVGMSVLSVAFLVAIAPLLVLLCFFVLEVSLAFYARLVGIWQFRSVVNLFETLGDKARQGREGTIPFFKKFYGGAWRFLTTMFAEGRDFVREWREAH